MKKLVLGVMIVGLILCSGCSMLNYSASKQDYIKRVATQRAIVSGDQAIIKTVGQGNYVAVGVDLLDPDFWAVLKEHPIRATLAAAADLAAAAAATWAISETIDRSNHDNNNSQSRTLNVTTTGNGNNTSVTVDNSGTVHNESFAGDQTKEYVQP